MTDRRTFWLTALACALPFVGFWVPGLFDLDEGYYGAVLREMLATGDWITPKLGGSPWFEKPILLYWLAGPSVALFGEQFGPRLPSVLATVGTALLLGWAARKWIGEGAGLLAPLIYTSGLLVGIVGRMMITDALLVLALTASWLAFYRSFTEASWWRVPAMGALGVAVLAKGPVAVILTVPILAGLLWREPSLRARLRGGWLVGLAVFLVVVASWYLPCWLVNGQVFVQKFLIEQNLMRFAGGDLAHRVPWWSHPIYFPVILLAGLLPWTAWGPAWRKVKEGGNPFIGLCAVWFAVILLFFTVSGTKLPHYILPAIPAAAVLMAAGLADNADWWRRLGWLAAANAAALVGTGMVLDYNNRFAEVHGLAKWVRSQGGPVIAYKMGRPDDAPPEIKLELDESGHPSLGFYLSPHPLKTDDPERVAQAQPGTWLIVRKGRLEPEDRQVIGVTRRLERVTPYETERYDLYRVTSR